MKNLDLAKKIAVAMQKNEPPPPELVAALKESHPMNCVIPDKKERGWLFPDRSENRLYHLEVDGDKCTAYDYLDWDRLLAIERMTKSSNRSANIPMTSALASLIKHDALREKALTTMKTA